MEEFSVEMSRQWVANVLLPSNQEVPILKFVRELDVIGAAINVPMNFTIITS